MKFIYLLFKIDGRSTRGEWAGRVLQLGIACSALGALANEVAGARAGNGFALLFLLLIVPVTIQRLHDRSLSGWFLLWLALPVVGPLIVIYQAAQAGVPGGNRHGLAPADKLDYAKVVITDERMTTVNDVTQINPVPVNSIASPTTTDEIVTLLINSKLPISIGGGHFSMGGATASPDTLHLDLRNMNKVLVFFPAEKRIIVQAGIRWCDIQRFIDSHDLSVKIMQTYANFTVGGSLSVNAHGRYMGLGPVALSVCSFKIVLANGEIRKADPQVEADLFYAVIGSYGAIGIITEVELELAENYRVQQHHIRMPLLQYAKWFDRHLRGQQDVLLHNADMYPPHFKSVSAVSWRITDAPATSSRLHRAGRHHVLATYLIWAISETPFGKFRREHIIDRLLYLRKRVHYRNYEASYDAAELEPVDRKNKTWVLQEYFVPVEQFAAFSVRMADILVKYAVNALNVSIRHALDDPGTWMAWARGETFAFVLYYKQGTDEVARSTVAVWTRELIDAALACGGTYYLPYQPHATRDQFHRAYPNATKLFELKRKLDPDYRLRNTLWDSYYLPWCKGETVQHQHPSLFHRVYGDAGRADRFYQFLKNIFHVVPHEKLHVLIQQAIRCSGDDESIYRFIQGQLAGISPVLAPISYALPSLHMQKQEIARETRALLGEMSPLEGYIEIGSTGRYVNALRKLNIIAGDVRLINDRQPGYAPPDLVERGQLRPIGQWHSLSDYAPIDVPIAGASLVSAYIGLHHMSPEKLAPFLRSIHAALQPGGYFVVRDHDVCDAAMHDFVALAHAVFNAVLGEPWAVNAGELRYFAPVSEWVRRIEAAGFTVIGTPIFQEGDPTLNALMLFQKSDTRDE